MKYVLLDRDGVINRRILRGYVTSWEQFTFLPGALEGLRLFAERNYSAIVVSNQACVGKGLISLEALEEMTRRFVREIEAYGGRVSGVYYCPHRSEAGCPCRKPNPGLLLKAQQEHRFPFAETFLIGDSETDLQAALRVGSPAVLISNGEPHRLENLPNASQRIFPSLYAAAQFILGLEKSGACPSVQTHS